MKTLLRLILFFLLVTQINFAQSNKQMNKINFKSMKGQIDQQDKRFPKIDRNLHTQQSNRHLSSDFESKLKIGIDKLDEKDISNPFQNERFYPIGHRITSPSTNKFVFTSSQISVIDTADVISEQDTMRHLYSFNANAKMTTDLIQKYIGGFWADTLRRTYTYDARSNMLSELWEYWENSQWVYSARYTYTYDANNNVLSFLTEGWENSQLVYSNLDTYLYDANNNILSEYKEHWENRQLEYKYWYIYTYDENNNMLTSLYEYWNNGHLTSFFSAHLHL